MPDKHQFNELGAVKACIWCNYKVGAWVGESVLAAHSRKHVKDREAAKLKGLEERAKIERSL